MSARNFKSVAAARKAAKGHWGTHIQYVRKAKKGYTLFRYPKKAKKAKKAKARKKKR